MPLYDKRRGPSIAKALRHKEQPFILVHPGLNLMFTQIKIYIDERDFSCKKRLLLMVCTLNCSFSKEMILRHP